MTMLRNSTLNQLKRINSEIKKQGGTTDRTSNSEKGLPNACWIHDPIDADKSGKRKIATYDQMFKIDIPDAPTRVTMKNEKVRFYKDDKWFSSSNHLSDIEDHKKRFVDDVKFTVDGYTGLFNTVEEFQKAKNDKNRIMLSSKSVEEMEKEREEAKQRVTEKQNTQNMKNILSFEKMFENGPNDTPVEIMKNMKTIKNWFSEPEYNARKEMSVGLVGKFIDTGKVKGYINRIEGNNVIVDSIVEPLGLITIPLKIAMKSYKPEKEKDTKVSIDIQGPNNKSLGGAPKGGGGYSTTKLDGKSDVAKDQKISNQINKEKSIKKLSDMSDDFDSTTIKTKSEPVAPKINGKGVDVKDQKISDKNNKENKIAKLSDLSEEPKTGKVKGSENEPGKTIDGKGEKVSDNKITSKNTSVKTFTQMQSEFEGPKSKK